MATIEIISRPKANDDEPSGGITIVSRPKPVEGPPGEVTVTTRQDKPYAPEGGFFERAKTNFANEYNPSVEQFRKPGAFNKAMGALGWGMAWPNAVSKTIVGDPMAMTARNMGASPTVEHMVGETGNIGAQVFGGAPVAKGIQEVAKLRPADITRAADAVMTKLKDANVYEMVNKGADAVGGTMRSTVNAVEDLVKQRMAGAERSAAEKAANAPPTTDRLYTDAGKLFDEAKLKGGELPPGYYGQKVSGTPDSPGLRDVLLKNDINVADHPELYKQASEMLKVIERKVEGDGVKSFADLIKLHREMRPYVRRAKAEAVREGDETGLRAATILRGEVGKLLDDFPDAAGTLGQAKEMWKRAAKMEDVEDIVSKASRINNPDYIQKEFRSLALDDYAMNNYTAAERVLIDKIAGTSRLENVVDVITPSRTKGVVNAVRGTYGQRMKLAKELKDLIARGPAAQEAAAAAKAAKPSFSRRTMDAVGNLGR